MAESPGLESVLTEIVGRLMRDLDDVIALIQRPLAQQAGDADRRPNEIGPAAMPALA